jgi:hypothetical protein
LRTLLKRHGLLTDAAGLVAASVGDETQDELAHPVVEPPAFLTLAPAYSIAT